MDTPTRPLMNMPPLPSKLAQQILACIADNSLEPDTHLGGEWLARQL